MLLDFDEELPFFLGERTLYENASRKHELKTGVKYDKTSSAENFTSLFVFCIANRARPGWNSALHEFTTGHSRCNTLIIFKKFTLQYAYYFQFSRAEPWGQAGEVTHVSYMQRKTATNFLISRNKVVAVSTYDGVVQGGKDP